MLPEFVALRGSSLSDAFHLGVPSPPSPASDPPPCPAPNKSSGAIVPPACQQLFVGFGAIVDGTLILFSFLWVAGGGQKERKRENPKQAPCPARGPILRLRQPTPRSRAKPKPGVQRRATEPPGAPSFCLLANHGTEREPDVRLDPCNGVVSALLRFAEIQLVAPAGFCFIFWYQNQGMDQTLGVLGVNILE